MKYTKAPWFAVEYAGHWDIQDGKYYGDNCIFDEDIVDEAKDNVHLAIKAPEMLEALKGELIFLDEIFVYQSVTIKNDISIRTGRIKSLINGIES